MARKMIEKKFSNKNFLENIFFFYNFVSYIWKIYQLLQWLDVQISCGIEEKIKVFHEVKFKIFE